MYLLKHLFGIIFYPKKLRTGALIEGPPCSTTVEPLGVTVEDPCPITYIFFSPGFYIVFGLNGHNGAAQKQEVA